MKKIFFTIIATLFLIIIPVGIVKAQGSSSQSYSVSGNVSGANVAGLKVNVIQKGTGEGNLLGTTNTNSSGSYLINFQAGSPLNIQVQVYNSQQALLASSPIRNNASRRETINITVSNPSELTRTLNIQSLKYPIKELGNCKNRVDCKSYCDIKTNTSQCLNYGEQKGLMSRDEVVVARAVIETTKGPGGCTGKDDCATFCSKSTNINICLDYAEKNKLMTAAEIVEAKKIITVVVGEKAKTPGNCNSIEQCASYCDKNSNVKECVGFGSTSGILSQEEVDDAEKLIPVIESGDLPEDCKTEAECIWYCAERTHWEECGKVFKETGLMRPDVADVYMSQGLEAAAQYENDTNGNGSFSSETSAESQPSETPQPENQSVEEIPEPTSAPSDEENPADQAQ